MIGNALTLVKHDLAVAFKNKTFILLVCIPLFVFATLRLVDDESERTRAMPVGYLAGEGDQSAIRPALAQAEAYFSVRDVATREEGIELLENGTIRALLVKNETGGMVALVTKRNSPDSVELVQRLQGLQIAATGDGRNWLVGIESLRSESASASSLPTWLLMVILIVAFFVLPAQVAEEKERQWLTGLLQTPMREEEWLFAKVVYGIFLSVVPAVALHVLGKTGVPGWQYGLTLALGSFCFGAAGVTLGLLCRNQATARTIGVICYLPLILPVALHDSSATLRKIAPFMPSFALYNPVQSLVDGSGASRLFPVEWAVLACLGLACVILSRRLLKVRWLMQ
jgi:ABC-2 type transport system permease protein